MTERVTIEVDAKGALARHIEDLQRAIAQRNKTIEHLKARLTAEGEAGVIRDARKAGFREGWQACAGELMGQARKTAKSLEELQESGFKAYMEGDRK